ncbi:MAG: DMT family transporter [Chitinophagales bacterium]
MLQASDLVLILVTLIWGVTFSLTKRGVAAVPPLYFLAIRFTAAFAMLLAFGGRRLRGFTLAEWQAGLVAGFVYAAGFITQTLGLQRTLAAKAAFITGLSVILVPVLSVVFLRQSPEPAEMLGSAISFVGLAVLSVSSSLALLSFGDFLVLLCAIAFALHIILVGRWAQKVDPYRFTTVQVGVTGLLCGALGVFLEPFPAGLTSATWFALGFLALFATVGTTLMQTWAQRHTDATRTAVIFTLEPVFAAVFAFFILGEVPTTRTWIGGLLIITGILLAELRRGAR